MPRQRVFSPRWPLSTSCQRYEGKIISSVKIDFYFFFLVKMIVLKKVE